MDTTFFEQIIRGVVYNYQKASLGIRLVKLSNFSQCIVSGVFLQNCKGYIGVVFRSPSQGKIEFENFRSGFDELLSKTASSNSLFIIILGNFIARSSCRWKNKTKAEALTS